MKTIASMLLTVLVLSGCEQAAKPGDPSVITSRSQAWEDALNAGDVDALVDLYAADARVMPPNGESISGHDAVRAAFGPMIDGGLTIDLRSLETQVIGDIGYNVGAYVLSDGDEVIDTGKYVEIWRRGTDGVWRYTNDIWNSDLPPIIEEAEEPVARVLFVHEVEDGDLWLDAWRGEDSRRELFLANGAEYVRTFRSVDDPDLTGLLVGVADMAAINTMLESEEGIAAATADGVDLDEMSMLIETE